MRRRLKRRAQQVPGLLEFLESVPWSEFTHAYGDASDVPELIIGLLDDDARDETFHDLWGTVWHQGTVYSASAPAATALALVAAADGIPQRDVVIALLASIATGNGYVQVHWPMIRDADEKLDAIEEREARVVAAARQAVVDSLGTLRARLADPAVEVRRALPQLLAVCDDQAARPLLRARLESERDSSARASAVLALGALGDHDLPDGPEPVVRLASAVAAADTARVVDALDGLPAFDELGNWTEGEGMRFVLEALPPPGERLQVLTALAADPDEETRHTAIYMAGNLASEWRSLTPAVIDLHIECLRDEDPEVSDAAARGLYELVPASAPAADALLRNGSEPALRALARLHDPRVVPLLAAALAEDDPARWTGAALRSMGALALEVRDRVIALLPTLPARHAAGGIDNRIPEFTRWLGELGTDGAPAVPAIVELLRSGRADRAPLLALRAIGPPAADARPVIEGFLDDRDPFVRAQAAGAIYRVAADPGPLHTVVNELLVEPQRGALGQALEALDDYPVERLEPLLEHEDEWVRLPAAEAILRITGDHRLVVDALRTVAGPQPAGQEAIALLAEMPPEAFAPLGEQLIHWRDTDKRAVESGIADEIVERDERLRELATQVLAKL